MKTVNFFLICVISFLICVIPACRQAGVASAQTSEEITITTYYPSPYGVYDDLEARDGFAVGDITTNGPFGVNSVDALDTGELWVEDSVIFRPLPGNPLGLGGWPAGKEGEIAYSDNNNRHYYFNGANWVPQGGGGGGCYVDYSLAAATPVGSPCMVPGFTVQGSAGLWGGCASGNPAGPGYFGIFFPPGAGALGGCSPSWGIFLPMGEAFVCCQ